MQEDKKCCQDSRVKEIHTVCIASTSEPEKANTYLISHHRGKKETAPKTKWVDFHTNGFEGFPQVGCSP